MPRPWKAPQHSHAYFGSVSSLRVPDLRCGDLEFRGEASELTWTWSVIISSGTLEVLCLWFPIGRVSRYISEKRHCSTRISRTKILNE